VRGREGGDRRRRRKDSTARKTSELRARKERRPAKTDDSEERKGKRSICELEESPFAPLSGVGPPRGVRRRQIGLSKWASQKSRKAVSKRVGEGLSSTLPLS